MPDKRYLVPPGNHAVVVIIRTVVFERFGVVFFFFFVTLGTRKISDRKPKNGKGSVGTAGMVTRRRGERESERSVMLTCVCVCV